MDTDTQRHTVKQVIATEMRVPVERLHDASTVEDLGLDSLTFAEVAIALERKFGRPLDPSKLAHIGTQTRLGDLVDAILVAMESVPVGQ